MKAATQKKLAKWNKQEKRIQKKRKMKVRKKIALAKKNRQS